jgi:hypothetical protein
MRRPTLNLIIDTIAFAGFIFLTTSGILMRYVLPPGSGRMLSVFGLSRHDWGSIHFWIAIIFLASLTTHLFLHWNWIVCQIKGKKCEDNKAKMRVALGIVGFIALLAFALAPLISPIEKSDIPANRKGKMDMKHSRSTPKVTHMP